MCCFPFVCLTMTALFHKSTNRWANRSFLCGTRGLGALLSEKQRDSGGVTAQSSPPVNRPEGKIIPMVQSGPPKRLNPHPVLPAHLAQPLLHIQLLLRGLENKTVRPGLHKCSSHMHKDPGLTLHITLIPLLHRGLPRRESPSQELPSVPEVNNTTTAKKGSEHTGSASLLGHGRNLHSIILSFNCVT